jgi:hypothetical protein
MAVKAMYDTVKHPPIVRSSLPCTRILEVLMPVNSSPARDHSARQVVRITYQGIAHPARECDILPA